MKDPMVVAPAGTADARWLPGAGREAAGAVPLHGPSLCPSVLLPSPIILPYPTLPYPTLLPYPITLPYPTLLITYSLPCPTQPNHPPAQLPAARADAPTVSCIC